MAYDRFTPDGKDESTPDINPRRIGARKGVDRVEFADGSVQGSAGGGSGSQPTKIHTLTDTYSSLGAGAERTIGTRGVPGYILSWYCATSGSAPPIASDMDWRCYYDGESSASFNMIALGDSLGPQFASHNKHVHGSEYIGSGNESMNYLVLSGPAPYDSVQVAINNPTGSSSPDGWNTVVVADELDIDPIESNPWRRHATGEEDVAIADGETLTLASSNTRGRFYGYYVDIDNLTSVNQDIQVALDGEATPSINLNTNHILQQFRSIEQTGGGQFGVGEYDDAAIQFSHYFTPGHFGTFSDFENSMDVTITNNGGAGELDYGVIWDEAT